MQEVIQAQDRADAAQELRMMQSLRLAIPASLDKAGAADFAARENELISRTNN